MNRGCYSIAAISLAFLLMLAGCSNPNSPKSGIDPDKPIVLKVAYFNESSFYQAYGNVFTAKYPNVSFEVIPTIGAVNEDAVEQMKTIIAEHNPDVVILSMEQYEALAAEGRLADLEGLIKQSGFDLDRMAGGVIELLRDAGGGKLYGLAPTFSTDALFYNKDLFARYGIPEPTDHMTWEQVLQLAARFPADGDEDTRIYGFVPSMFSQDAFELVRRMAAAKGLNYLNGEATELTMNAPEWKEVFQAVVEAYRSETVLQPSSAGGSESVHIQGGGVAMRAINNSLLFMNGRAAMTIGNSSMINMLNMSAGLPRAGGGGGGNAGGGQREPLNWDIVTAPVDAANPDRIGTYNVSQIFAVSTGSSQSAAAWEFIQYVHSDEAASLRSRTSVELQSRLGYEQASDGRSLEAFYKLQPLRMEVTRWLPRGFRQAFQQIAEEEIVAAVEGTKSIDEAFASLVARGEQALAEANLSGEKERGGLIGDFMVGQVFVGGR